MRTPGSKRKRERSGVVNTCLWPQAGPAGAAPAAIGGVGESPKCRQTLEKHFRSIIEEQSPLLGRPQLLLPRLEQAALHGSVEQGRDGSKKLAGPFRIPGTGHAIDQAQGVHQEVEGNLLGAEELVAGAVGLVRIQVILWLAGLPVALDAAVGMGELAMGAGTDADEIAVLPVVEIMPGAAVIPGVGGDLVLGITGLGQARLAGFLDVP